MNILDIAATILMVVLTLALGVIATGFAILAIVIVTEEVRWARSERRERINGGKS